jgi:hypothetical protein
LKGGGLLLPERVSFLAPFFLGDFNMICIKFVRPHGHYYEGHEVRLPEEKAKPYINGGYAVKIGEEEPEKRWHRVRPKIRWHRKNRKKKKLQRKKKV